MDFVAGKNYKVFARVDAFNNSDGIVNMTATLIDDSVINVKIAGENELKVGAAYLLDFDCIQGTVRDKLILNSYEEAYSQPINDETIAALKKFYACAPVEIKELEAELDSYLQMIKNETLSKICNAIFNKHRHDFLIYPAAVRMHHNYIGGLAYHTLTIAKLALSLADCYEVLDKDLLIAGALLHDIAKVIEFKGPSEEKYSVEGQLLGHLVIGAMEIKDVAKELGLLDKEEVVLLEHIVIAHHGQPQYGACKKPETPEALVIYLLDNIDSKLRVVDEVFDNTEAGSFTDAIGVLEKIKLYKRK